ncbi:Nif11-like leader peptide family RiPP precursor [Dapis sp. BLCC M229]|uniref:Nif11-like leader peptide family RiPP precursor n=1 Tax=Dapis sp. BLCC M229 TaxID=3400188 RepID=UPI003CEB5B8A
MSLEILEKVKDFLIRVVKDESFRTQLMSEKVEEVKKVMTDSGYNFSQEEFETATIQILDLKESGEFHELSEDELVSAVGGWRKDFGWKKIFPKYPIFQPMYGIVIEPPEDEYPKPEPEPLPYPDPQPMYGIVIGPPIDMQPMYGVIKPPELI